VKRLIKSVLPPFLLVFIKKILGKKVSIVFEGDYSEWNAAVEQSIGFDSDYILSKVRSAALKVKQGKAAFERDAIVFNNPEYRWPLLSILLYIALLNRKLHLLDFGGSLGSCYFQHIKWLASIQDLCWSIVEQKKFVESGRREFESDQLRFYCSIDECLESRGEPNAVLFSSVLQYLENPYKTLDEIAYHRISYLIIDRLALINGSRDRITVQHVPASIYKASYPARFFSEDSLIEYCEKLGYEKLLDFKGDDRINGWSYFKGIVFVWRGK